VGGVGSTVLGTAARATLLLLAHRCYGHNLTSTFSVWCMTSGSSLDRHIPFPKNNTNEQRTKYRLRSQMNHFWHGVSASCFNFPNASEIYELQHLRSLHLRTKLLQKVKVAPHGRFEIHVVPVVDSYGFRGLCDSMKPERRQV